MRICRISRTHPHKRWPGSGLTPYHLARALSHPCLYITKDWKSEPSAFPSHVQPRFISYPEPRIPEKVGRLRLVAIAAGKTFGSTVFLMKALPHMLRFRPDIIHIHTPLPLMLGMAGKAIFGVPLVLTFHGTDYARFKNSRTLQFLVNRWVDAVICVSSEMESGLKHLLPTKTVTHVPTAVDLGSFRNQDLPRKEQLIAVGRMVWQKGYEDMLAAMQIVAVHRPDLKLVIAGDGIMRQEIEGRVKSLGLQDRVILKGALPQSEIPQLLNESKLFVSASVSEGMPKALLEALACGTPAVVTDVGDCGLVARDAGMVVTPGNPRTLADAILKMLSDRELWESCSQQADKTAANYTWEGRALQVLDIYEGLGAGD